MYKDRPYFLIFLQLKFSKLRFLLYKLIVTFSGTNLGLRYNFTYFLKAIKYFTVVTGSILQRDDPRSSLAAKLSVPAINYKCSEVQAITVRNDITQQQWGKNTRLSSQRLTQAKGIVNMCCKPLVWLCEGNKWFINFSTRGLGDAAAKKRKNKEVRCSEIDSSSGKETLILRNSPPLVSGMKKWELIF